MESGKHIDNLVQIKHMSIFKWICSRASEDSLPCPILAFMYMYVLMQASLIDIDRVKYNCRLDLHAETPRESMNFSQYIRCLYFQKGGSAEN